jgi:hypothetical protein
MEETRKAPIDKAAAQPVPIPNTFAVEAVYALSFLRIAAGAGCLLAPTFTGRLFRVAITPNTLESTFVRLSGIGLIVLGELAWFSRPKFNTPQTQAERQELRHVLWASIAADVLDAGVVIHAITNGILPRTPALLFGGSTIAYMALGLFAAGKI